MAAYQAPPSLGFSRQEHWSGLPFPSAVHESEKWKWRRSVMSDSVWPHRWQPTRLLHPCDSPGKNTGVGCHCLLLIIINLYNPVKSSAVEWSICIIYGYLLTLHCIAHPPKTSCIFTRLTFSFMSLQQRHRHCTLSNIPNTQHSILASSSYNVLLVGMSINTVEWHSVTSPLMGNTMTSNSGKV